MSEAIFVCSLDDIGDPGARGFSLALPDGGTLEGFVVRKGADAFAYVDSCPHTGAPLAWTPDQYLDPDGMYIQCALHGALFVPGSGYCVRGPCAGASLSKLELVDRDGRLFVITREP